MSIQMNSVALENAELLTVMKNEPPESEIVESVIDDIVDSSESKEEIILDIKDDIVYHPLCEDLIKSETIPENVLESKHLESVETQIFVKIENTPFVKIESENLNKTADIGDKCVNKSTYQGVVEVQGSNKHFNTLDNLEINKQPVNFPSDLNGISTNRKAKRPKKAKTASWEKDKEKIKVIKAPVIPVKAHEYTSLAKDRHVCNHCQYSCNRLDNLKLHIKKMHREVTTMYQCPYCPFKSKWSLRLHIIQKHKDTKDIQWFQCYLCDKKFKLKHLMIQHTKVHLTREPMQDSNKIEFCPVCGKEFTRTFSAKRHMRFVHNKEERNKGKRKCRYCEYTTNERELLEHHIKNTHKNYEKRYCCEICALLCSTYSQFKLHKLSHKTKADMDDQDLKYRCNKCNYKAVRHQHLINHKLNHLKPEEIPYFYCYHCSYKSKRKDILKKHIFTHDGEIKHHSKCDETKNKLQLEKRYCCDKCSYKTDKCSSLKRHKIIHLKPEEIQYFYCYHCSHKNKDKHDLKKHIFRHFRNEDVPFHCYICDFMTLKRESIIAHIKKHSKVQIKFEINEGS